MVDWGNAWMALKVLGIKREEMQVAFLDYHEPFDNLDEGWKRLFSPSHPMLRVEDIRAMVSGRQGERLCFRHAIFGLVGYLGFLHTDNDHPTAPNSCYDSELVKAFSNFVVSSIPGALQVPRPTALRITLIVRREHNDKHYQEKKIFRTFQNEKELIKMLESGKKMSVEVADLSEMSFDEQVLLMRRTSILIGAHGAGLTNLIFLPPQAIVVELSSRTSHTKDLYFRNLASWMGLTYVTYGSFDKFSSFKVDTEDFKKFLDPLVRMSRQFFLDTSECGFAC